jgi:hypothetical protein
MDLINATGMQAGYTMGLRPDGRELLVVVIKGTFTIPKRPKEEPVLAEKQVTLVDADVFSGEPGVSAPLYESDYAPRKPRCDVLLNGSAYAPGGKPADRVTVSLRVGSWQKSFDVVGDRVWNRGVLLVTPTDPKPFTVMPISYDNAFGGVDRSQEDPSKHRWYPANHAGVGYHEYLEAEFIDGRPLPNTEETGKKVTDPQGKYRPMAFGPIARAWPPRPKYAGTYDQKWLDDVSPFLPADFDERYYQSAPDEQQIPCLLGGETVELINLTPEGKTTFKLPNREIPAVFLPRGRHREEKHAVIDTVIVEPDEKRFMVCWRTHVMLKRNIFEIPQTVVGTMSRGWWRARDLGKDYYPSLRDLVHHQRNGEDGDS